MAQGHGNQRRLRGVVVSEATAKTITVRRSQRIPHPKYGKMVRRDEKIHVHDETEQAHVGDTVEIIECRPMSRTKRWRLLRVLQRSPEAAVGEPATAEPTAGDQGQ
jgi:small subunit ribosomal protein S17